MILVVGGTGRLGRLLVPQLVAAGEVVRVLARHATSSVDRALDGAQLIMGDVRDPDSLTAAVDGVHLVISAVQAFADPGGGTPRSVDRDGNATIVEVVERTGASLILLSVIAAAPSSPFEYFRMKWAAEETVRHSSVPWTIVRASAFLDTWVDLMVETAGDSGRPLVFGRGDNPLNFVMAEDVAAAVLHAVGDPTVRGEVIEVGGPEDLTLMELARRVQASRGWTRAPRRIPRPVLRVLAGALAGSRPVLARQMRASVAMDTVDGRFDPTGSRARHPWLSCSPLRVGPAPADTPA